MAQVLQTRTSLRDLDSIWDYIADDSPEKASRFIRELREKMDLLAEQPRMGRNRDELSPGLRSFPFDNYNPSCDLQALSPKLLVIPSLSRDLWFIEEHGLHHRSFDCALRAPLRMTRRIGHNVGNYMVFYRVMEDGIIINRVLHGRQNIDDLFE